MQVTGLSSYPIKSLTGIQHQSVELTKRGLLHDRNWVIIDDNAVAITARDYPKLLLLSVQVSETKIEVFQNGNLVLTFPLLPELLVKESVTIFSGTATGFIYNDKINNWFSEYLGTSARLAVVDESQARYVREKHGGSKGDMLGFADQNPILIISEASLQDLNSKLEKPVTMTHFRPNIVVSGCDAFEEDNWKNVKIGECEFEIVQQCMRCIFTTIDPITAIKGANKEPIRTLSGYRNTSNGIAFGAHAVPRKIGNIQVGDKVNFI